VSVASDVALYDVTLSGGLGESPLGSFDGGNGGVKPKPKRRARTV